jgi:hypothetical protein
LFFPVRYFSGASRTAAPTQVVYCFANHERALAQRVEHGEFFRQGTAGKFAALASITYSAFVSIIPVVTFIKPLQVESMDFRFGFIRETPAQPLQK